MTFEILNVTSHIDRPFGFQDALAAAFVPESSIFYSALPIVSPFPPTLLLNDKGCIINSATGHNCTSACQDVSAIWNSPTAMYTLQNCMIYPIISKLISIGNLSKDALQVAHNFGILPSISTESTKIIDLISTCLNQYCDYNGCPNSPWPCETQHYSHDARGFAAEWGISTTNEAIYHLVSVHDIPGCFRTDYCDNVQGLTILSPDLGGPGVFISYLFQASIAIGLWILQRLFDSWIRNAVFWILPFPVLGAPVWCIWPHALGGIWLKSKKLQEKFRKSRQRAALLEAMVEFQKAQCFFMLAIQIAALLALSSGQNILGAVTYNEQLNNANLLNNVAVNGILPIVQVLWYLHVGGMRSWYVVFLSISTFCTSAATRLVTQGRALNLAVIDNTAPKLDSCGGVSPIKFCYSDAMLKSDASIRDGSSNSNYLNQAYRVGGFPGISALYFSCFVLFLVLINQCDVIWQEVKPKNFERVNGFQYAKRLVLARGLWSSYNARMRDKASMKALGLDTAEHLLGTLTGFAIAVIDFFFFTCSILLLQNFSQFYMTGFDVGVSIDTSAWSFGQIIAVTVWLPFIFQWLYSSIWGLEKSGQHRIPKPFKVIKDDHNELIVEEQEAYNIPIIVASQAGMITRKASLSPSRTPSPQPPNSRRRYSPRPPMSRPSTPRTSRPSTPQVSRPSTPQTSSPLPSTTQVLSAGDPTRHASQTHSTLDVGAGNSSGAPGNTSVAPGSNTEQQPSTSSAPSSSITHTTPLS